MDCIFCSRKCPSKQIFEVHYQKHTHERPHFCSKCPKELNSKHTLIYHLKTHEPREERALKCHICGKLFLSESGLETHVEYHVDGKKFKCKICGERFEQKLCLTNHKTLHKREFLCNTCNKSFYTKSDLTSHENMVHRQKQHKCNVCGWMFSLKSSLNNHLQTHSVQRKRFQCDRCPKRFLTKWGYEEHILIHQNKEYSHKCDKCDKSFLTSSKLKDHKRDLHLEKARIFSCVFCEKKLPNFCRLEIHLADHTFERPSFCKHCPAEFRNVRALRLHNKSAHCGSREVFKCELCPRSFLHKFTLDDHIRDHMGELYLKCKSPGCEMQFSSYYRRKDHYVKAHVGKKFCCSVCGKKFFAEARLRRHALVHSDLRSHPCKLCAASFKHHYSLKHHEQIFHTNI